MCIYLVCVYLATQVVIVIEDRIHSCEYSCIMLILLVFHFCLHYIACRAAHVKHFSYFVRMYFTSAASISTSSSLDGLLLRKPISEKQWYMIWNQRQLFMWKDGKLSLVQTGSKSVSAGPVLELDDQTIQVCSYNYCMLSMQ